MSQIFREYGQSDVVLSDQERENRYWCALREGDKKALAAIYDVYAEQMLGYGLTIFKNRDLVKDGIQDVFVDVWKYRKNLGDTNNVKLYLFKALRTKIYKNQKLASRNCPATQLPPLEKPEWAESHESMLINMEISEKQQLKLYQAMEKLPARQREVLRNLYFDRLSYEETSFLMAMNIQSVYNLVWKAISNLKKHIVGLLIMWLVIG